ncbi:MAG: MBL fold metallo-hydrolase [Oscillospiraceae bacterium]|nr:MBL fold metallo-hydrolase [Oscillospiraceae bacterium]
MQTYHITVLEIGGKTVGGDFYFGDFVPAEQPFPNPFSMTLLQGGGRNILIDSGINTDDPGKQALVEAMGLGNAHSPREILATVGLSCADIAEVILTNAHADQASGLDCYPNATFYLQREELVGWQMLAQHPNYTGLGLFSMDMSDVSRLEALERAGRLVLLDGDAEPYPGIHIINIGSGHSFALQMVLVDTEKGRFLHVGDACNRPENLTGTEAFPFYLPNTKFAVGATIDIVRGYDRILELVSGDIGRLIMTHDDSRRDRFPWKKSELDLTIFEIC